jgi:hypothetical protein
VTVKNAPDSLAKGSSAILQPPAPAPIATSGEIREVPEPPESPLAERIGKDLDVALLEQFAANGNPFAITIINHLDRIQEPVWFYKDSTDTTQGPFSTLNMYQWYVLNYFPPDLQLSFGDSNDFIPMNNFSEMVLEFR